MIAGPVLDRPTLLDGAMGTALIARGLGDALPEEWLLSRPDEIAAVHAGHAAAGARVLLTCTFNAAAPRLAARVGEGRVEALCEAAVRLARSVPGDALVAGAVGPTALALPGGAPPEVADLRARYARPLAALARAGADLLWIESQWDLDEALAALAAARATGLPAVVSFGFPEEGRRFRVPGGQTAEACLASAAGHGAVAAGVNCVAPAAALAALAAWASAHLPVPFVAKPSPGLPGAVLPPDAFADALRPAFAAGLRIAGGCCGATADHLRAIGALVSASA